eukprot:COSAG05_NODE_21079_length_274_cov_1.182857_1_plen_45_part_01
MCSTTYYSRTAVGRAIVCIAISPVRPLRGEDNENAAVTATPRAAR